MSVHVHVTSGVVPSLDYQCWSGAGLGVRHSSAHSALLLLLTHRPTIAALKPLTGFALGLAAQAVWPEQHISTNTLFTTEDMPTSPPTHPCAEPHPPLTLITPLHGTHANFNLRPPCCSFTNILGFLLEGVRYLS